MNNKKFNVLFLTYQGGMAGSTFSISYLAKGLADRGHKVFIGIRKEMPIWDLMDYPGIVRIPMRINGKFDFNNWREIRDTVLKYDIRIINAQSSHDRYTSIFSKIRYHLNVKIVHTRRQNPLSSGGWLQRQFYIKFTSNIIVISKGLKSIFVKKGYPEGHIKVIHNGIPKSRYNEWSEERVRHFKDKLNVNPDAKIIGCISRFKEQPQLIKAIANLNDPSIELLFAGTEPDAIQPYLDEYKVINKVHLLGKVPSEDILNIYRILDINVLPSTMDGFGLVLIEAMAMGCPVIATNFGGIPDVIQDGENGFLFDNENIIELQEKIKILLKNHKVRNKLIKNGLATAFDKFTMEKTIEGYESFFLELAEN